MMKTRLIAFAGAILLCAQVNAQTTSFTFDNAVEQNQWNQFRKGAAADPNYLWTFDAATSVSPQSSMVHIYPVGGSDTTDDWHVSPVLDFSNGGMIDSVWQFFAGFGTPQPGDTVALYVLNGDMDPDLATSKTQLILFSDSTYQNNGTWSFRTGISVPTLTGNSYLAFRYKTVNNWLDVRFDNLVVSTPTSVDPITRKMGSVKAFPNPTNGLLQLEIPADVTVNDIALYDLVGNRVAGFEPDQTSLNLNNLAKGAYFLRVSSDLGQSTQTVIRQ